MIGTVQTVGLAAGFLFLSLNQAVLGGAETLLFGTFLGITQAPGAVLLLVALAALGALAVIGPARCCSPPSTARSPGPAACPWPCSTSLFLLVLALAIAATSQITGALLVFALLVAPPAAAQLITAAPARRAGPERRLRPADRLARARARLLLHLSGRLLRDHARLRPVRRAARRARVRERRR